MEEVFVNSWNELQDALYADSWRPELKRYRSPYAFRGLQDATHKLETSLMRIGGEYERMEKHLLRNFRKYAGSKEVEKDSIWNWLSLAKHYWLPNRLLDWSFSPLVALHFATSDTAKFHMDGAVWAVDYSKVHQTIPAPLKAELDREGSDVFTVNMLSNVVSTLDQLDSLSPHLFAVFFEPPSIDDRIVNQYALFSMMSSPTARFDHWLDERPDLARKIIIPGSLKWEIRDKLDQANITERVLFPGLDGLSLWLKRQYSPRD